MPTLLLRVTKIQYECQSMKVAYRLFDRFCLHCQTSFEKITLIQGSVSTTDKGIYARTQGLQAQVCLDLQLVYMYVEVISACFV